MTSLSPYLHSKFTSGVLIGVWYWFPCFQVLRGSWKVNPQKTTWLVKCIHPHLLQDSKTQRPTVKESSELHTLKEDGNVLLSYCLATKKALTVCMCVQCICSGQKTTGGESGIELRWKLWCPAPLSAELYQQSQVRSFVVPPSLLGALALEVCVRLFIHSIKMARSFALFPPMIIKSLIVISPQVTSRMIVHFSFPAVQELDLAYIRITWRFSKISVLFSVCATDWERFFKGQTLEFAFHLLPVWKKKN